MKELAGSANGTVRASVQRCYEFLTDVKGYERWYPETVRSVEVVESDSSGTPTVVNVELVFAFGPLKFENSVPMTVVLEESKMVWLHRVPDDNHDPEQFQVKWLLDSIDENNTELKMQLSANLDLPPFLPGLNAVADEVARGFVYAAASSVEAEAE